MSANEMLNSESIVCPVCGSNHVKFELYRDEEGSKTITNTKSKTKKGGHGIIWWLLVGWWWWIIDLFIWIYAFIPRLLIQIFKPKKSKTKSRTVQETVNHISYKTICICQNCGHNWVQSESKVDEKPLDTTEAIQNKVKEKIKNIIK